MRPLTVSLVPSEIAMRPGRTSPLPMTLQGLSPDQAMTLAAGRL